MKLFCLIEIMCLFMFTFLEAFYLERRSPQINFEKQKNYLEQLVKEVTIKYNEAALLHEELAKSDELGRIVILGDVLEFTNFIYDKINDLKPHSKNKIANQLKKMLLTITERLGSFWGATFEDEHDKIAANMALMQMTKKTHQIINDDFIKEIKSDRNGAIKHAKETVAMLKQLENNLTTFIPVTKLDRLTLKGFLFLINTFQSFLEEDLNIIERQ